MMIRKIIPKLADDAAMCRHSIADTTEDGGGTFDPAYFCRHPKRPTKEGLICLLILLSGSDGKRYDCKRYEPYTGRESLR